MSVEAINDDREEWAAIEFDPWVQSDDLPTVPTNKEWVELGPEILPTVRLGYAVMFKTKNELIAAFECNPDAMIDFIDSLRGLKDYFEAYVKLLESSHTRLLVAASAASMDDGDPTENGKTPAKAA